MMSANLQLRKFILRRMDKHQHPGSGSQWDRERDKKMGKDRLSEWAWLEDILAGIPHVIIGGMAVNQFAPPRFTEDFDVAVAATELDNVVRALETSGFQATGTFSIGGKSLRAPDGTMVDIVLLDAPWAQEAIRHPYRVGQFPVLDIPYLVLLEMKASRAIDIGDMQRMLHGTTEQDRDRIRAVFRKYDVDDLDDLEQLIALSDQAW